MDKDVTKLVMFGDNDGELLPILKCVCGERFDYWDFTISIYSDDWCSCKACNRWLFFKIEIKVYEKVENEN